MPTYSYSCRDCGTSFDIQQAFTDDALTVCPNCGGSLRKVFGTRNELTFPVSGTGSAGMEAALANVVEPGDLVIIGVNGVFGGRMVEMAKRMGERDDDGTIPF